MKRTLLSTFVTLLWLPLACSQMNVRPSGSTQLELAKQIDLLMQEAYPGKEPGAAVLVVKKGEVLFRKAYGMANLELDVPMSPNMIFRIGSITKQFTAVCILMLAAEGKLKLQDSITRFITDYPTHGKTITIEHLVNHTSGIRSYTSIPEWIRLWRKDLSLDELIDMFKDLPLEFEPGERWSYSNSGYVLLGAIIEEASGMSYEKYLQKRVLDPLGMKQTHYDTTRRIIPRRIPGYQKGWEGYENASFISITQAYSAGALISTVDDLARWDAALYTERLAPKAWLEKAWTTARLKNGKATGYGYGWIVGTYKGHKVVRHSGGIHGFLSDGIRLPDDGVFVTILSNNQSKRSDLICLRVAALVLAKPIRDPVIIKLEPDVLSSYVGVYQFDDKTQRSITLKGNQLFFHLTGQVKFELHPISISEFFVKESDTRFRFERNDRGEVVSMLRSHLVSCGPPEKAQKTDLPLPAQPKIIQIEPHLLKEFVGSYQIAPGSLLSIQFEGEHLMFAVSGQKKQRIMRVSKNCFVVQDAGIKLEFRRDESGEVQSVLINQDGQTTLAKRSR